MKLSLFSWPANTALLATLAGVLLSLPTSSHARVAPADAPAFVDLKYTEYAIPGTGTRYVAADGSASNSGTIDSPWTLARALAGGGAPAGSTIILRGGTYRGTGGASLTGLNIPRRLTLQPYPGEKVWIKGSNVVTDWTYDGAYWSTPWSLKFNHAAYGGTPEDIDPNYPEAADLDMVFIDSRAVAQVLSLAEVGPGKFYIDDAADRLYLGDDPNGREVEITAYAEGLNSWNGGAAGSIIRGLGFTHFANIAVRVASADMTLQDNTFAWNGVTGLNVSGSNGGVRAVVWGNTAAANGKSGLTAGSAHNLLFENNYVGYNNVEGFRTNWSAAGTKIIRTRDMVIRGNLIERNYATGLWMDISSVRASVVHNVSRFNASIGLFAELQHDSIIAFNLCHDNGTGIMLADSSSIRVYNNTLSRNNGNLVVKDSTRVNDNGTEYAQGITWITRNNVVKNNVFSNARSGSSNPLFNATAPVGNDSSAQMVTASNYNAYYRTSSGAPATVIRWDPGAGAAVNYANVNAFRAAYPAYEANAVAIDNVGTNPFFVNEGIFDFRLKAGSVAINRGEDLPQDIADATGVPASPVHLGALGTTSEAGPPLGINKVGNRGFEDASPAPWTLYGSAQVVTGNQRSGSKSLALPGDGDWAGQVVSDLVPGGTYALRGWGKIPAGTDAAYIGVDSYDESGGRWEFFTSSAYTAKTIVFTVAPWSTSAHFWYWKPGAGTAYGDDFELVKVP